jgi:hypothetical protein
MKAFLLSLALLVCASAAAAQIIDIEKDRVPVTALTGPWHFQAGDNPAWSDPAFDDSAWPLLTADKPWFKQGYPNYLGIGWYRIKLIVPGAMRDLALYIPSVSNSCQVFANGQLIGQIGGMPPKSRIVISPHNSFAIPDSALQPGRPLVLAVRFWRSKADIMMFGAGFNAPPAIGDASAISIARTLYKRSDFWSQSQMVFGIFANLLTGLAALGLFALRRKEREYLWFGIAQIFWGSQLILFVWADFRPVSFNTLEATAAIAPAFGKLFNLEFFIALMGQRRRFLYWAAAISIAISVLIAFAVSLRLASFSRWSASAGISELIYALCVPALLFLGARRGSWDARLLFIPFTLSIGCNVILNIMELPALLRHSWGLALYLRLKQLSTWPFPVDAGSLLGDLAMFSVIAVLILRFARSRRDEERLAAELDAARAVQHVLIPDEIPVIPGLHVDCAYKPAGQVGGDFFQILPLPDGGALIAIGDVSGKGMPAAMTVSLFVGMMRMLARSTQSPADILQIVNQNMIGRTPGGFITCLMLHISNDGIVTAANAGHLAPYINGMELAVDTGIPLGLEPSTAYPENSFPLAPEDQLTLLTDGVLEARNASGELFGFERAASLSRRPAAEIARAAAQFGQDDDITVLSLTRQSSGDGAAKSRATWTAAHA